MLRKICSLGLGLVMLFSLSGCALLLAGAAGGAGTAFWLGGKLESEVAASYQRTIDASKRALSSLGMEIVKEAKSDEVTQIRSEYTDGRKVWLDIRKFSEKTSKLEIRVGAKGDQAASTKLLERIKKYL
ncbi:MAG: DUF3568 domain-containing protein [Candidatus Omnitrophica bacterium]|nr:DUF3568 domain-containing protein [Candidatus Omnitrophota bacterium]